MPHITLEYSDNLEFEVQSLLADLHHALTSTGAVELKGIKSRAVCRTDYRVADGDERYAFVHAGLLVREGRPPEVRQAMVDSSMEALKNAFGSRFEGGYISLSVDLKEMRAGNSLTLHNIPAGGIKPGEP